MRTERHTPRDGLVVGLVAYAAVAVFYSVLDVLAARGPLFTVDMLGRAVFRGLRDPGVLRFPHQVDPTAVLWYNGLHLLLALAIGLVATGLVTLAERRRAPAPLLLLTLVAGGTITVLTIGEITRAIRPVLPWWSIVTANVLAASLAGAYLLARHPIVSRNAGIDSPHGPRTMPGRPAPRAVHHMGTSL